MPAARRPPHPATVAPARSPHVATVAQRKAARPWGPPAAPPHPATLGRPAVAQAAPDPRSAGVVQRISEVGALQAMCTTLLASYQNAVEFQAMSIDRTVMIAANRSQGGMAALLVDYGDWNVQQTTAMLGVAVVADTGVQRGKEIKTAADAASGAGKLDAQGVILLKDDADGGGNNLHAEQKLLHVLAQYMRAKRFFGTRVVIAGRNPPCGTCRRVLDAFARAYNDGMYGELEYDKTNGQARDVPKLNLSALYPDEEFRFGDFVADYTRRLG